MAMHAAVGSSLVGAERTVDYLTVCCKREGVESFALVCSRRLPKLQLRLSLSTLQRANRLLQKFWCSPADVPAMQLATNNPLSQLTGPRSCPQSVVAAHDVDRPTAQNRQSDPGQYSVDPVAFSSGPIRLIAGSDESRYPASFCFGSKFATQVVYSYIAVDPHHRQRSCDTVLRTKLAKLQYEHTPSAEYKKNDTP